MQLKCLFYILMSDWEFTRPLRKHAHSIEYKVAIILLLLPC